MRQKIFFALAVLMVLVATSASACEWWCGMPGTCTYCNSEDVCVDVQCLGSGEDTARGTMTEEEFIASLKNPQTTN